MGTAVGSGTFSSGLSDGSQKANLLLAHPSDIAIDEPWYLVSNADPTLDLVWSYAKRFCCEQLFRDQKSGLFQLESSGLRDPGRIDRLLLVVAIAVLVSSLQGYAVSLDGLRHQVDPHWQRGMSFVRIGLKWLQQVVANAGRSFRTLDTDPTAATWNPASPVVACSAASSSPGSRGLSCLQGHDLSKRSSRLSHDGLA